VECEQLQNLTSCNSVIGNLRRVSGKPTTRPFGRFPCNHPIEAAQLNGASEILAPLTRILISGWIIYGVFRYARTLESVARWVRRTIVITGVIVFIAVVEFFPRTPDVLVLAIIIPTCLFFTLPDLSVQLVRLARVIRRKPGESRTPETANGYMQEWARIEIRGTRLWLCAFLEFLGFLPFLYVVALVSKRFVFWAGVLWGLLFMLTGFFAFVFRCPRCGKRFQRVFGWNFSRRCIHCGLQRPRRVSLKEPAE